MSKQHIITFAARNVFGKTVLLALTAVLAVGCETTPTVKTDSLASSGLASCHTFAWDKAEPARNASDRAFANPLNERRLHEAVASRLSEKGVTLAAEATTADCLVSATIGSRQTVETSPAPVRWGFGLGWGRPGFMGSMGWNTDEVYAYREGRISVDVFDARSHDALWHAHTETDVSSMTGASAQKRIDRAVNAIFDHYPGNETRN